MKELAKRLASGWNTWHVKSMLTHVLLPEGMALQLGLKEYRGGQHLREVLKGPVDVRPGLRSYDGNYTDFAAYMFSLDCPELAMANAIAITDEITEAGFVPNFAIASGCVSRDRSEPPVGAWVCREINRRHPKAGFLEAVYDKLLRWNRWWWETRQDRGLLCWGSTPYEPVVDGYWETHGVNERFGASLESGLDNSPMYDDIPFDASTHRLALWDVGLNSLYVADCEALADIATTLGRALDAAELNTRAEGVRIAIRDRLWSEEVGLFLNRRTDTGEFSRRMAPPCFYPLLAGVPTPKQAVRMIAEHFRNPDEFWGEWMLPSIARNDPAYPEQSYWRGRVWGPMNFLVYLGLRRYDAVPEVRAARLELVAKSQALLMKNWRAHGHVLENYNAETGDNTVAPGKMGGDAFYYWGGLLGTIALMEAGCYGEKGVNDQ